MAPLPLQSSSAVRSQEEYFRGLEKHEQIQRKPVFSFDEDYTFSLLEPIFRDLCPGADYEKLSEKTHRKFCFELDKCDLQAINPGDCDSYIDSLLEICSDITKECTGKGFHQWQLGEAAILELRKTWKHFVLLVSTRDFEWENLVQDTDDVQNASGECVKTKAVQFGISQKLMVPLQMWALLLRLAAGQGATSRGVMMHRSRNWFFAEKKSSVSPDSQIFSYACIFFIPFNPTLLCRCAFRMQVKNETEVQHRNQEICDR